MNEIEMLALHFASERNTFVLKSRFVNFRYCFALQCVIWRNWTCSLARSLPPSQPPSLSPGLSPAESQHFSSRWDIFGVPHWNRNPPTRWRTPHRQTPPPSRTRLQLWTPRWWTGSASRRTPSNSSSSSSSPAQKVRERVSRWTRRWR